MTLAEMVDPQTTALLIVDMQNDFLHPDGAIAKHGVDVSLIRDMAPRLLYFMDACRRAGTRIVHIRTHHSPWTNSESWTSKGMGATVRCFPGSWGAAYYPGFEPRTDPGMAVDTHEYEVTKHRYSAFIETDLDLVLRSHGIRTLLMTGEATNVCVESTARDGFMKDYFVLMVEDCMAASSQDAHDATLRTMRQFFGPVVSSAEICREWEASS